MNRFNNIDWKIISLTAGATCLLLSILLIVNTFQLYINNSIEPQSLNYLTVRLSAEQNGPELLKELRNFDSLAHKALFCSPEQIKICLVLFILGVIALGISVAVIHSHRVEKEENTFRPGFTRKSMITAFAIVVLTFTSSFISLNYFEIYSTGNVTEYTKTNTLAANSGLKQISSQPQTETNIKTAGNLQETSENTTTNEASQSVAVSPKKEITMTETSPAKNEKATMKSGLTIEQVQNNHNSFRGPFGNGVSYHKNIPVDWDVSTGKNLVWKTKVPKPGNSSPIIWQNKLFLTGADNAACVLYCFDANNGNILLTGEVDNNTASTQKIDKDASFADPTATTNGELVFAIFGTGHLICFDMDGNKKWTKSLGVPQLNYGYSSSLVTWADKLFVQFDTGKGGKLIAFDNKTGKIIWETGRNISQPSWASPVLAKINGKMQLVLTVDPIVAEYDIQTGEEIWSVECTSGEVAPSVTVSEETVFAGMEYANVVAVNPEKKSVLWENSDYLPEVSSPVAFKKYLFVATSYGDLAGYNTETGEVVWENYCDAGFYASPVIADNKMYAIDKSGIMHVVELEPEIKEINTLELQEKCYATPAFSEGRIFIRGKEHLFCFGK